MKIYLDNGTFMQRISDYVGNGYHWHVGGVFLSHDANKIEDFALKMVERYETNLTAKGRHRNRSVGMAVCVLLAHVGASGHLLWKLLATDGDGAFHDLERSKRDARLKHERISLATGFELVKTTRPAAHGGGEAWTWRMTDTLYKKVESNLTRISLNCSPGDVEQALYDLLMKRPMFRGIRSQSNRLLTHFRREWIVHRGDTPLPELPSLPYIRRQRDRLCLPNDVAKLREYGASSDHTSK